MNAVSPPADPATERLNYRNGQRIEAVDLRVEQAYHIAVRRWLNRSLYTPGIAKGLEVTAHPTNKHMVIVSAGLAFDAWGREIILAAAAEVWATGVPSTSKGVVFGNYMVIEYAEERAAPGEVVCSGVTAPTRIRAVPRISIQDAWPMLDSGKIPLAQIELRDGCEVEKVHSGIRKYVSSSKPPKVRSLALEGEKDIDPTNRKLLNFHISGSYPDSAILFLQATRFSTLYYSELGWHAHPIGGTANDVVKNLRHTHLVTGGTTSEAADHTHNYNTDDGEPTGGIDVNDTQVGGRFNQDISAIHPAGKHKHDIEGITLDQQLDNWTHGHALTLNLSPNGTNAGATIRSGASYSFFTGLRIKLDGTDITAKVIDQVKGRRPSGEDWALLGDGSQGHAMVVSGTGEIDLLQLGLDLGPRAHTLEFVPTSGGGQLHYNLYVE